MKTLIYYLIILVLVACKSNTTTSRPENQNIPVVVTDVPAVKEEPEVLEEPVIEKPAAPDYKVLKFNVAIGISPSKPDWVLYKNGSYIIFPSGYTDTQMTTAAGDLLDSFSNQTVSVNKSHFAKGWIANTSKGVYTFVSQEALGEGIHSQETIRNAAIANIKADKTEKKIVHINRKK
jgi:hypothetical protein